MTKQYVTVELCDAEDVIDSGDAVKYVRMALDHYQSQATMDLYKVRPAGPSLGEDDSTAHNSDYAAAIRVWREEWLPLVDKGNHIGNFAWYCVQRLNSAKAPNCA